MQETTLEALPAPPAPDIAATSARSACSSATSLGGLRRLGLGVGPAGCRAVARRARARGGLLSPDVMLQPQTTAPPLAVMDFAAVASQWAAAAATAAALSQAAPYTAPAAPPLVSVLSTPPSAAPVSPLPLVSPASPQLSAQLAPFFTAFTAKSLMVGARSLTSATLRPRFTYAIYTALARTSATSPTPASQTRVVERTYTEFAAIHNKLLSVLGALCELAAAQCGTAQGRALTVELTGSLSVPSLQPRAALAALQGFLFPQKTAPLVLALALVARGASARAAEAEAAERSAAFRALLGLWEEHGLIALPEVRAFLGVC